MNNGGENHKICRYCEERINEDDKFCIKCGNNLSGNNKSISSNLCFVIILITTLICVISILLFIPMLFVNQMLSFVCIVLSIISGIISKIVRVYAIVNYPNKHWFKLF